MLARRTGAGDRIARAAIGWRSRTRWFVLACLVGLAVESYVLFVSPDGRTLDVAGMEPVVLWELGTGSRVSQGFLAEASGLRSITLSFRAEAPAALDLRCELLRVDASGDQVPVYRWMERLSLQGRLEHTFDFAPVAASRYRQFRFSVQAAGSPSARVGLDATRDDAVRPGELRVDGVERWGDLVFRTSAVSRYRIFLEHAAGMPALLLEPAVHLPLLAAYNLALIGFAYAMTIRQT